MQKVANIFNSKWASILLTGTLGSMEQSCCLKPASKAVQLMGIACVPRAGLGSTGVINKQIGSQVTSLCHDSQLLH